MSLKRRIGRNALAKVTGEVVSRAGGFLLYFLLARWLGPAAFGRWSFALSYATLFAVMVDLGTNVIVTREIARSPERLQHFVPRLNGLKLASSLGFLLVLATTLPFSERGRETVWLVLAAGAIVAGNLVFESWCAILSGLERMELEALAKMLAKAGLVAGAAAGFASTHSLPGAAAGLVAGTAASLATALLIIRRVGAPAVLRWDAGWTRALLAQSLTLAVSWIFWNVYDNQDVVVLAYLGVPNATVGHFAAAMKVIDALRGVPVLLTGAIFPLLSTSGAGDRAHFDRLGALVLRGLLAVALPAALGASALASPVIRLIYGPGFEPAAVALSVAAWALIGIFLNHALIGLLVALDLQRLTIAGAVGAVLVNLGALLILAPRFGLAGAGAALVVSEGTFLAINLALLARRAPGLANSVGIGWLSRLLRAPVEGAR